MSIRKGRDMMDEAVRKGLLAGMIQLGLIYFGGWFIISMIDRKLK